MHIFNQPGPTPPERRPDGADFLFRFQSWRVFLLVAIAVNALFVWGMWGAAADPGGGAWIKVFSWLPFNFIATALYFVFMVKLSRADEAVAQAVGGADRAGTHAAFHVVLCVAMIAANWIAFFAA